MYCILSEIDFNFSKKKKYDKTKKAYAWDNELVNFEGCGWVIYITYTFKMVRTSKRSLAFHWRTIICTAIGPSGINNSIYNSERSYKMDIHSRNGSIPILYSHLGSFSRRYDMTLTPSSGSRLIIKLER